MRKKQRFMACIYACTLFLTACGQSGEQPSGTQPEIGEATSAVPSAENTENPAITVYCQEGITFFNNAIREFEQRNDVEVNVERFEDAAEMESRITAETLSGKGPDVWLFSENSNTLDIHKMMANGSFYALNELIEEEKGYGGWQEERYYPCMLEAGQFDGKQYILPLSFNMTQYYAETSLVDTCYPGLEDGYDMRELMQAFKEECGRTKDEPYQMGLAFGGQTGSPLYLFIENSQKPMLDYEKGQLTLDRDMLEEIMEFWRLWTETQKREEIVGKYGNEMSIIEHFSFWADGTSMLNAVRHNVSQYAVLEKEAYFYLMPAWDKENSYLAFVTEFGGVNKNSSHPKEAYGLLRAAMDYQMTYDFNKYDSSLYYNLPVNKTVLHSALQLVSTRKGKGKFDIRPLTDEYKEQLEDVLKHIDAAVLRNPKVSAILDEVMKPYIIGEEELDTCYTTLENRLKLYLAE